LHAKFNKERKGLLSDDAFLLQGLKNISHSDVGAITQVLNNENREVFAVYLEILQKTPLPDSSSISHPTGTNARKCGLSE